MNLVKRLFSSSNQQLSGLPPTVLEQLTVAPFAVEKVGEQLACPAAQHSSKAAHNVCCINQSCSSNDCIHPETTVQRSVVRVHPAMYCCCCCCCVM
jgi:hypothetical protein